MRVEITDDEGTVYTLSLQGSFTQDKLIQMMELLNLLGHKDRDDPNHNPVDETTSFGRILKMIRWAYPTKEFSSADVARDYEDQNGSVIH